MTAMALIMFLFRGSYGQVWLVCWNKRILVFFFFYKLFTCYSFGERKVRTVYLLNYLEADGFRMKVYLLVVFPGSFASYLCVCGVLIFVNFGLGLKQN